MNVALCNDHPFRQFDFPGGADQGASGGAFQISGLPDHALDPQAAGVCYRDLNLCLRSAGAKDHYFFKPAFRTDNGEPFPAGILTRLA